MKELRTEIEINASPNQVWEVLSDFGSYPTWNPFITEVCGVPKEGERLVIRAALNGGIPPGRASMPAGARAALARHTSSSRNVCWRAYFFAGTSVRWRMPIDPPRGVHGAAGSAGVVDDWGRHAARISRDEQSHPAAKREPSRESSGARQKQCGGNVAVASARIERVSCGRPAGRPRRCYRTTFSGVETLWPFWLRTIR